MPVFALDERIAFPDPRQARADGLLAVGGDLAPERLVLAYSLGIFPWYSEGEPILWWSPNPRLVLFPEELHLSGSLKRKIGKGIFDFTLDKAFGQVIRACAKLRPGKDEGTWITREMIRAYEKLFELGFAHSVEAWQGNNLAGGLYGVSIGRYFAGESMFFNKPDASKAALWVLCELCLEKGLEFIDCQVETGHLVSLGARLLQRDDYFELLQGSVSGALTKQSPLSRPWKLPKKVEKSCPSTAFSATS
jgi:leucyl/phenylalanyl-tRNA--protein transferase